MKIVIYTFSRQGYQLMKKIRCGLQQMDNNLEIYEIVKCNSMESLSEKRSLLECVEEWFYRAEVLIFIGAAGIAVRSIAPFLKHKAKDPAVLVIDEKGNYCISLLSGHTGGGNAWCKKVSAVFGGTPVITTATDCEGLFAVDEFARRNKLQILDWKMAKRISVAILEGKKIGFFSDCSIEGIVPKELYKLENKEKNEDLWINISYQNEQEGLLLIPPIIVVGIGCRKNTSFEKIAEAVTKALLEEKIKEEAVCLLASIDLKKEEQGILRFSKEMGIPFVTFQAEDLKKVEGVFSESAFVEQTTGVSNVCERSAVLASGGQLLCKKKIYDGVTIALARKKKVIYFE